MSQTVSLVLSAQTRQALQTIVDDRRQAVKHVLRARIVLLSDERLPVLEVARQAGVSRPMVWRWQQRFAEDGLDSLLRDKTRPPGMPATPQEDVQAVLERTLTGGATLGPRPRSGMGRVAEGSRRAKPRTGRGGPWRL